MDVLIVDATVQARPRNLSKKIFNELPKSQLFRTKSIKWQVDLYRRPLQDESGHLWELLICDATRHFTYESLCSQSKVNSTWLISQLQIAANSNQLPDVIEVFRPQTFNLLEAAGKQLNIPIKATRHTSALKQWLQEKAQQYPNQSNYTGEAYNPLAIDKPPPLPLPENLWGKQWRFATLSAGDIESFKERPIPILEMPDFLLPLNLGLSSAVPVPGVVIDGGKLSMRLARWLESAQPVSLSYVAGAPDGLVLEAGLVDRWVVATF